MTLPVSLPYGIRDIKICPYPDLSATAFGTQLIDLPNAQTFSFTETEEYTELRGDDKLITSHGQGAQLNCELESGGISIPAYLAINGGQVIESGTTPNQVLRYRKKVTDQRPFYTLMGQAISDSGGDFHCIVYRVRATGDLTGELSDGNFLVPGSSHTGFPCLVDVELGGTDFRTLDALYDFVQNETITALLAPVADA